MMHSGLFSFSVRGVVNKDAVKAPLEGGGNNEKFYYLHCSVFNSNSFQKLNSTYSSPNLILIKQYSINGTFNDQMFPSSQAVGPQPLRLMHAWSRGKGARADLQD